MRLPGKGGDKSYDYLEMVIFVTFHPKILCEITKYSLSEKLYSRRIFSNFHILYSFSLLAGGEECPSLVETDTCNLQVCRDECQVSGGFENILLFKLQSILKISYLPNFFFAICVHMLILSF